MRRSTRLLIGTGALVGLAGALWQPVAVPYLARFPASVDTTTHYEGELVTFLDAAAGEALERPATVPLQIERRYASVDGRTGADVAVVRETVDARVGGRPMTEERVWALDRRTMENVADPSASAFGEPVDRAGSFYLNLPMDFSRSAAEPPIWNSPSGATYRLRTDATRPERTLFGLEVSNLVGRLEPTPVTPGHREVLAAQGLPMTLSPEEVAARLQAAGVPMSSLGALESVLTAEERTTLAAALAEPVPLVYYAYLTGRAAAEHDTGMIVELSGVVDGIAVKPDLAGLAPVTAVLERYRSLPPVAAALDALTTVAAAAPAPVYELRVGRLERRRRPRAAPGPAAAR